MLNRELQNFGLSEKEASVYLAALELGTATIQELSKRSNVNRATTYIQVEALLKRGLLSSVDKDKKSVFMAEKPQRLLEILESKKSKIERMETKISKLMPDFEAVYNVTADRPRVRFFEGPAGLDYFRDELSKLQPREVMFMVSEAYPSEGDDVFDKVVPKIGSLRYLYVGEENSKNYLQRFGNVKAKHFAVSDFDIELTLFDNKVFMNKPHREEKINMAVLIEDKMFYASFAAMFNLFWKQGQELL